MDGKIAATFGEAEMSQHIQHGQCKIVLCFHVLSDTALHCRCNSDWQLPFSSQNFLKFLFFFLIQAVNGRSCN